MRSAFLELTDCGSIKCFNSPYDFSMTANSLLIFVMHSWMQPVETAYIESQSQANEDRYKGPENNGNGDARL